MNNDHIKKHRAEMNARITGSYNLQKSNEDELEKSKTEGSRGGHVIGHTKSGKAIYDTSQSKHEDYVKNYHHGDGASDHVRAPERNGKKEVDKKSFEDNHKDFTSEDHSEAASFHNKKASEARKKWKEAGKKDNSHTPNWENMAHQTMANDHAFAAMDKKKK